MNIAVIGSRKGFTKEEVKQVIHTYFEEDDDRLITGGAKGVDTLAQEIIEEDSDYKPPFIIRPINPSNKMDYLFRNVEIITIADKIIALWDGASRGTKFVIDYANARGKQVIVIRKGDLE